VKRTVVHCCHNTALSCACVTQTPLVENKGNADFAPVIEEFRKRIKAGEGVVLFAVCRGKVRATRTTVCLVGIGHCRVHISLAVRWLAQVSEGLDFADECGRGVIITGIPFPPKNVSNCAGDFMRRLTAAAGSRRLLLSCLGCARVPEAVVPRCQREDLKKGAPR
jgi:hypothetical protein